MSSNSFFFNPLIVYGNAYQHPLTKDLVEKISKKYDVLEFGNFPEENMLKTAITFFKKHKQYTHFSYIAPDLYVYLDDIEQMKDNIRTLNPLIISACCNVDHSINSDKIACCYRIPTHKYETRNYRWVAESQRKTHIERGMGITNMGFSGMALVMIRRDLFDMIDLNRPPTRIMDVKSRWEDPHYGYSWDLNLSHWLKHLEIPNYVDLTIKLNHDRNKYESQVGKQNPYIKYVSGIETHMFKCDDDR